MKKIGAILLLLILVFNFYGYRWLLSYFEENATTRLEQKLDAGDYDVNQLVEVKIPLRVQYQASWSDYETFYGETKWNGEYYQYVKRKLSNDTLYLLCIPHDEKTKIHAAKTDYFKSINNLPFEGGPQKSQQTSFVKLLLSEFLQNNSPEDFSLMNERNKFSFPGHFYFNTQFDPSTPAQPPESASA